MAAIEPGATAPTGPVIFAYDGSELAALAIEQAGKLLAAGQDALVVCVWQPADVGFVAPAGEHLDADKAPEVERAAEAVAAQGAALAEQAGFRSESVAVWSAPTWKGIAETAEERNASLIVIGSHRRSGIVGRLVGSVAAAVVAHSARSVLVVHKRSEGD
jgi:nucleotide-binding universal stress UspA family protein